MRKSLFKNYQPKKFGDLEPGDSVWVVRRYDKNRSIAIQDYIICSITKKDTICRMFVVQGKQVDSRIYFPMEMQGCFALGSVVVKDFSDFGWFKNKYRVFADEKVAKHSVDCFISKKWKHYNYEIRHIKRRQSELIRVQRDIGLEVKKIERTCKCITGLEIWNDCTKSDDELITFIRDHEYQVDIINSADRMRYKVYANGGWKHFTLMDDDDFNKNFSLIE